MTRVVKNTVLLSDTDPNKGPHVCLWTDDEDLAERFRILAIEKLPKELNWFHQCSSETYHMFEFWRPSTVHMTVAAEAIAAALELRLMVNLKKTY